MTAALAAIGTSRDAKRVAIAHVTFKLAGVLLFIFWIPQFSEMIKNIAVHFGSDTPRQLANAHTIFNVSLGLIFLPFVGLFSRIILWICPDKETKRFYEIKTLYIEDTMLDTPSLAIDLARAEMSRMAKLLGRMLNAIIVPFLSDKDYLSRQADIDDDTEALIREIPRKDEYFKDLSLMEGLDLREKKIDFLEKEVSNYLTRIAREAITREQAEEVLGMVSIVNDMENIGDIIHRNMIPLIAKKKKLHFDFSEEGKEELLIYHGKVSKQIRLLQRAFKEINPKLAFSIMKKERKYLDLESQYRARHLKRIIMQKQDSVATREIHMELMDLMKQILLYSANIAKVFSESAPSQGVDRAELEEKEET